MGEFLHPRTWISLALVSPKELEEKEFTQEQNNGSGKRFLVTHISKTTVQKSTGIAHGPFRLDIFSNVCDSGGEDNGIRMEIRGYNFMGEQYGEQFQSSWVVSEGTETRVGGN
nr:hypothetical protein MarQu_135 [Marseillevirus sp.]